MTTDGGDEGRHVVVVSHEASRTGAPRVALHTVDTFARAGWRTTTMLRWGGPMEAEFRATGTTRLDPTRHLRTAFRRAPSTKPLARALEHRTASHLLRRIRPDLVWCNTVLTLAWAEAAAAAGLPAVVLSHEQGEWLETLAPRLRNVTTHQDVIVLGCSTAAAEALERVGVPVGGVVHSPVDVDALAARAGDRGTGTTGAGDTVVACGIGHPGKGFDVFIEAARRDHDSGSTAGWRWIGRVDDLRVATPVELVGELVDPILTMGAASIFVCPSRSESFPLVVLEAMALGKPIVASDLPGIREQVGDTAVLVPPGDADALLDAVRALRDDPDLAADLGRRAQGRCREMWDIAHFRHEIADLVGRVTHQ